MISIHQLFTTNYCRGGINLTFIGTNFDVVVEPVFVYTDARLCNAVGVSDAYLSYCVAIWCTHCRRRLDSVMEERVTQ